jgi:hypothetical protein
MKCNARKLYTPEGGFNCSILGSTNGADWLWEQSPYKEKILNSPECDAKFVRKKGVWGKELYIFSCWVMGEFKVDNKPEELEDKVKAMYDKNPL